MEAEVSRSKRNRLFSDEDKPAAKKPKDTDEEEIAQQWVLLETAPLSYSCSNWAPYSYPHSKRFLDFNEEGDELVSFKEQIKAVIDLCLQGWFIRMVKFRCQTLSVENMGRKYKGC